MGIGVVVVYDVVHVGGDYFVVVCDYCVEGSVVVGSVVMG